MNATPFPLRRPRSLDEMLERVQGLMSEASMGQALAFQPRPEDVFIATYPKCGTTWMQMVVHALRSGGDSEFEEITEVVPWLELGLDMGIDIHGQQRGTPRAFKTHLPWSLLPKGGRYINVVRDPADVAVSQYHFWDGWFFESGCVTPDDVARVMFIETQAPFNYWDYLLGVWPHRGSENVLLMCFEQMKADPEAAVRRVARFIGVPLDDTLLRRVLEVSSVDFMARHPRRFDDHLFRQARDAACGIPPGGGSAKVRRGQVGESRQTLSPEALAGLEAAWRERIGSALGFASYADLRERLQAEQAATGAV